MTHTSLYHVREPEIQSVSASSFLLDENGTTVTDESGVEIAVEENTASLLLHAKGEKNFYNVMETEVIAITSSLLLEDGTALLNEDGTELLNENHASNMRSILYHG